MPEARPDVIDTDDIDTHDRIRQLHEQLLQGDILEYLGYERGQISDLLHADKRSEIFNRLMEKREEVFPGVEEVQLRQDLESLSEYLDMLSEMQRAHENFKQDIASPEKAGIFRRAFESVKSFAKRHPVVTALLVAATTAAAVAGGYYLAANIESAAGFIGLGHLFSEEGASQAAEPLGELIDGTRALPDYFQGPGAPGKF